MVIVYVGGLAVFVGGTGCRVLVRTQCGSSLINYRGITSTISGENDI